MAITRPGGPVKEGVIYTRVSSREQQQEGFSLGAQGKGLREYADGKDIKVVRAFEDVETAKVSGRKQFSEMVAWFKRNPSCPHSSRGEDRPPVSKLPRCGHPGRPRHRDSPRKAGNHHLEKFKVSDAHDSWNSSRRSSKLFGELTRGSQERDAGEGIPRYLSRSCTLRIQEQQIG